MEGKNVGIKETYSDSYQINFQDMEFRLVKDEKIIEMSKLFHFNIDCEMPAFVNEYRYVFYDHLVLDKTMNIKCYMSPIIILMTNSDYNLVMKCLFHNISYDDGCDQFMIHTFKNEHE